MRLGGVLVLLSLAACAFAQDAPRPVAVTDSVLLRWLLQPDYANQALPGGDWSIAPATDTTGKTILLRDGSEFKRLPREVTAQIIAADPDIFSKVLTPRVETWHPVEQQLEPDWSWITAQSFDSINSELFQRKDGIEVGKGYLANRSERWFIRDFTWLEGAVNMGRFRGSVRLTAYNDAMNTQREIRKLYGANNYSDYSFSASVSWLGLTYGIEQAPWVLPEYYWLEPKVDTLLVRAIEGRNDSAGGKVISLFRNKSLAGNSTNVVHKFELRLWHLRYMAIMDGDMYTTTVHRFAFEDVPTSFGQWGVEVVTAGGITSPGFWVEFGPIGNFEVPVPRWNVLGWSPLRLELMYLDTSHFRLGLSTRIRLGGKE